MIRTPGKAPRRPSQALLLALLASALAPGAAEAVVVMARKGEKRAELLEKAHQFGLAHPWVVGLRFSAKDEMLQTATGAFLGVGPDGRTGHVLTAAHVIIRDLHKQELRLPARFEIVFGPALNRFNPSNGVKFQADRIHVHPGFQIFQDASLPPRRGKKVAQTLARNDLAVIRFDLGPGGAALLAARGIEPARLYDGAGFRTPLREAAIVGYGLSGTTKDLHLEASGRIHGGRTKVTYGTWRGLTGFLHWSPVSAEATAASRKSNFCQCDPTPRRNYVDPVTHGFIPVESHPEQVLGNFGDSGGPLILFTRRGPEVAGIYSAFNNDRLPSYFTGAEVNPGKLHYQYWVPVKEHLGWIRPVMGMKEGKASEARVIDLTGGPVDLRKWGIFREMETKEEKKG